MTQSLWTPRLRLALLKLVVVFTLVIAISGFGHAGSHAPDHALSNVVHEHNLISDKEANDCEFHAASGICATQPHGTSEHQDSTECCYGVCMSFLPPQPLEAAACAEASVPFFRATEFESSAGAFAELRPPRV